MGTEQDDLRGTYRIDTYDEMYLRVSKKDIGEWAPEYIFDPQARALEEFEARCDFHQTSSESHFQHKKVCSRPIENGRLTVSSDKVKIKQGDEIEEQELESEEDFHAALWEHFRIKL
jgi:N-hydroxyarylamine O-acetyltransferase